MMGNDSDPRPSNSRLIDLCEGGACSTSGEAEMTTGITADSIGFVVGPGPGSLEIDVGSITTGAPSNLTSWEVLIRGEGTYSDGATKQSAPAGYAWMGTNVNFNEGQPVLTLATSDSGARVEVADIRYVELTENHACTFGRGRADFAPGDWVWLAALVSLIARSASRRKRT